MPTKNDRTGFRGLGVHSKQNLRPNFGWRRQGIETRYVQDGERLATHGIDVAQCVGGGDQAVLIGIIDNWRKKVHGLHQSKIVRQLEDTRVVSCVETNKQVRIDGLWELAEHVRQLGWAQLTRSTRAGNHVR